MPRWEDGEYDSKTVCALWVLGRHWLRQCCGSMLLHWAECFHLTVHPAHLLGKSGFLLSKRQRGVKTGSCFLYCCSKQHRVTHVPCVVVAVRIDCERKQQQKLMLVVTIAWASGYLKFAIW